MKEIGTGAFHSCKNLKQVTFAEGSRLEELGRGCFYRSGIEEVTLPGTVKEVGDGAFDNCSQLRIVWVEEGCALNVRKHSGNDLVIFPAKTMVGDKLLKDLRR